MSIGENTLTVALLMFLAAATIEDLVRSRISNVLTFGAAGLALVLHVMTNGFDGLLAGAGGLVVGFAVFLPFFLLGGMGAGDVKMMAAAGAFLTPLTSLFAAGVSLVAGSVLGLAILVVRGGAKAALRRYRMTAACLARTGRVIHGAPAAGEVAAHRFPYAAAIAVGTLTVLARSPTL
jgi:prepilin peptidase CpaA